MTAAAALLLAVPLVPLLLMLVWCMPASDRAGSRLLPWAPLPALAAALLLPDGASVEVESLLLGARWSLHGLTRPFLFVTAVVWLAAGHYARGYLARGYLAGDARRSRFELLWLATLAGNLGLIVAGDIASFYTFFSLMSFAAYGLVVHDGNRKARVAGRVYLAMAVVGEMLLLAGLLLAAGQLERPLLSGIPAIAAAGNHAGWVTGLLLAGFGVKAGLPVLHMWLPLAHPAAPTPASAVLSGAMIKAGLLGWLLVLPLGDAVLPVAGGLLLALGVTAAFGAALIGVTQRQPKAVLAYSSVSQMGVMTLLVGVGLLAPELWTALLPALLLFAVHHGVAKAALFLGVGVARHTGGLPRWLLYGGIVVPGLALAGAPFSSGALVKGLAKQGLYADQPAWLGSVATALAWSSVATAALMARYLWRQWLDRGDAADRSLWPGWLLLVALTATAALWLPMALPVGAGTTPDPSASDLSLLWAALWPLLAVAIAAALLVRRGRDVPEVPPGDLLVIALPALRMLRSGTQRAADGCRSARARVNATLVSAARRLYQRLDAARAAEELANRYGGHALVVLLLIIGLLLI